MRGDPVIDGVAALMRPARHVPQGVASSPPAGLLVNAAGLGLTFEDDRGRRIRALRDIDLQLARNEIVGLLGPSGCGKTSLLRVIAGLLPPTEGVRQVEPALMSRRGMDMAMVFQRPTLLSWLSVEENILLPYRLAGAPVDESVRERADRLLRIVRLEGFRNSRPPDLSGGMQGRVALVRAVLTQPRLIIMDEPFSALDEPTRLELSLEMLRLVSETHATVLIVSHALQETVLVADRILQMSPRPGRIVAEVAVQFRHPRNAALLDQPEFLETCARLRNVPHHG